jgi:hypothetical protein
LRKDSAILRCFVTVSKIYDLIVLPVKIYGTTIVVTSVVYGSQN